MKTTKYVVTEFPWGSFLEFPAGLPLVRHADSQEATRFNSVIEASEAARAAGVPRFEVVAVPTMFFVLQDSFHKGYIEFTHGLQPTARIKPEQATRFATFDEATEAVKANGLTYITVVLVEAQ